jgi:hypothetical protein
MTSLTVVVADTENHILARSALEKSIRFREISDILIYSDDASFWPGYPVSKIEKIRDISGYNSCIINRLADDLTTDFALIVQYDGFVLREPQWSEGFLKYDYIGAPWFDEEGWHVGNGGFSLRSRRLIDAIGSFSERYNARVSEDVFICKHVRRELEALHFRYAPLEVARRFSCEWPIGKWKTFGFHGIFHLPNLYADQLDFLLENLSEATLQRRWQYIYATLRLLRPEAAEALRLRYSG